MFVCFNRCSICLGEYREKEILRIIPTCRHSFHLACLDLWLQKQTTCPICRVSLKELQAAMPSARSIQQLPANPENYDNPAPQRFLPARQDHRGQNNSHVARESVEVVIEILRWTFDLTIESEVTEANVERFLYPASAFSVGLLLIN